MDCGDRFRLELQKRRIYSGLTEQEYKKLKENKKIELKDIEKE